MLAKACRTLKVPVIASGASAVGSQLAAAISMGACGITMATRFLATKEAPIRHEIKVSFLRSLHFMSISAAGWAKPVDTVLSEVATRVH